MKIMQKLISLVVLLYYLLNGNVIQTNAIITRNALEIRDNNGGQYKTMADNDDDIDLYAKHMAYFISEDVLSHGKRNTYKGVGVVIYDTFILTNLAWDPVKKKNAYHAAGVKVKKVNATIYLDSLVFDLANPQQIPYNRVESLFGFANYLKKGVPPDMKMVAQQVEDTQLTIVVANKIITSDTVAAIPMARKPPEPNTECVILTYGQVNLNKDPGNLSVIRVKVLEEATCKDELCEYVEKLCVKHMNESMPPISSLINGGEPLICKGELWGILRGGVQSEMAAPCTGIFDHLSWLNMQISQTNQIAKSFATRFDKNILVIILLAFILWTI